MADQVSLTIKTSGTQQVVVEVPLDLTLGMHRPFGQKTDSVVELKAVLNSKTNIPIERQVCS